MKTGPVTVNFLHIQATLAKRNMWLIFKDFYAVFTAYDLFGMKMAQLSQTILTRFEASLLRTVSAHVN